MKILFTLLLLVMGLYADSIVPSKSIPCSKGQYYRLKTKECLSLKNPSWGFQEFSVPESNVYPLTECTQVGLENLLNSIPKEGGKVLIPSCTINIVNGITLPNNVILQGAGVGKTIISNISSSAASPSCAINLRGENNIVRHLTINGNGTTLNGIDGYHFKGNALVEFVEAKNFKFDQGSGIAFLTKVPLENSRLTIRYNISYNGLHGIDVRVNSLAKALIYSNEVYGNSNYGIDMRANDSIEVAGNYMHHNAVAGAKSPVATNIIYHHNDINFNGKAGLVYMGSNPNAIITVENNDISNNNGAAFACWDTNMNHLVLINNKVSGSVDTNGYNINGVGVRRIDLTRGHGKIYTHDLKNMVYQ